MSEPELVEGESNGDPNGGELEPRRTCSAVAFPPSLKLRRTGAEANDRNVTELELAGLP